MKIPVDWFRTNSSWDTAFPRFILDGAAECQHFLVQREVISKWSAFAESDIAVFVIPGQHSLNDYDVLNEAAGDFDRVIFIINGDEESLFRADRLEHPNKKVWWFAPPFNPKQKVDRVAPFGWPVGAPEMIAESPYRMKDLPWSFAGQITHERRQQLRIASWSLPKEGFFFASNGFSQGLQRGDYYNKLVRSKFVLCPAGPHTPDTFRFAEALEAKCIPIVENRGYWEYIFGTTPLPFPVVEEWHELPDMFSKLLEAYDGMKAICDYWWVLQKEKFIAQMKQDLAQIPITGWITK